MTNLTALLEVLIPQLVDETVVCLARTQTDSPLFRLKLWYYDTHAPACYFQVDGLTRNHRDLLLATRGRDALSDIWDNLRTFDFSIGTSPQTEPLLAHVYQWMGLDSDEARQTQVEDWGESLSQRIARKLAWKLNYFEWPKHIAITDDFIVYAQNGTDSGCDTDEDLNSSVPPEKLELLRTRQLMGPRNHYTDRPGFQYGTPPTPDEVTLYAHIQALPAPERLAYWIGQLDKMAAGADCDMTRVFGVKASYPLRHVCELGTIAVIPLLELAAKWAGEPEWLWNANMKRTRTSMPDVMIPLFWSLQEMGYIDRDVELRLREILQMSCRANDGKPLWGLAPLHCADTLHKLTGRYPKPELAGNALVRPEQFFAVPVA